MWINGVSGNVNTFVDKGLCIAIRMIGNNGSFGRGARNRLCFKDKFSDPENTFEHSIFKPEIFGENFHILLHK